MQESIVSVRQGMFTATLRSAGAGDPLLFLHGAGGLWGWEPLAALASTFTVYAPAHPGFETSTGLEHLDDVIDLVVYYNDFLDALGLDSVHVVGQSMGGMLAAELAALSPQRVRKLVLVNAVGLWLEAQPVPDFFAMTPAEFAAALWYDPDSAIARRLMAVPEDEQAQLDAYLRRQQHLAAAGKFLWPIPDKGLKKRLHRIHAPTLLLWGEADGIVPLVYAQEFQRRIPGARVTILPRCGHMLMYEDTTGFVSSVAAFLQAAG